MCPLQAMPKQWSVVAIPAARTCRRSSARPVIQRMRAHPDARAAARQNRRRLGRHTHPRQPELPADLQHQPPDGRMQMHMLVRIGVVQRQPGGGEGGELRADLGGELAADARTGEVVDAEAELVGREPAVGIHQVGNLGRRQHSRALDHHEMQSDAQVRQRARAPHGIRRGGTGHHQAGGVQRAGAVRSLDRLVDRFGQAEIVGREDDTRHGGAARSLLYSAAARIMRRSVS